MRWVNGGIAVAVCAICCVNGSGSGKQRWIISRQPEAASALKHESAAPL